MRAAASPTRSAASADPVADAVGLGDEEQPAIEASIASPAAMVRVVDDRAVFLTVQLSFGSGPHIFGQVPVPAALSIHVAFV
jgi:hypothetical protein